MYKFIADNLKKKGKKGEKSDHMSYKIIHIWLVAAMCGCRLEAEVTNVVVDRGICALPNAINGTS